MIQRARNGKIARLPFVLREEINRRMRDNTPRRDIIAWLHQDHADALKAAGIATVPPRSLSSWRIGGHKDWLRQQERLEEMKARREFAFEIAQQSDGAFQTASLAMSASQVYEALLDFDVGKLKARLTEKPELHSILVEAVAKLSRTGVGERKLQLELAKYQDKVAEQKRKIEEQLSKAKAGGLKRETIAKIEEALNLL